MAEVIRGGIQAVDKGQREAALSIGMTKAQVNRLIVLPQALRIVIPSFGNEFVTMIKETAVLSYVGCHRDSNEVAPAVECFNLQHF